MGWHSCLACEQLERDARNAKRREATAKTWMSRLKDMSQKKAYVQDSQDLLDSMLRYFRGADGVARKLFQTYRAAKAGSHQRVEVLKMISRLMERQAEFNEGFKDTSLISQQDLEIALLKLQQRRLSASQEPIDADVVPERRTEEDPAGAADLGATG